MQLTGPVAFIGSGLMGTPIIKRLLGAGFAVRVWNRTASKLAEVVAAGAVASPTIAEACDGAQAVCTCLSNANAVEQVVFAAQGVVAAARPPAMLVDFSTIGPVATRAFSARLAVACGTAWVDAPVSGGPTGAAAGKLVIFCGGDSNDIERARALFDAMAQRVTHFGTAGNGQAAKVCNQVIVGINLQAVCEALALGRAAGADLVKLREVLLGGSAASWMLQNLGPAIIEKDDRAGFRIDLMLKDLRLAGECPRESDPLPLPARELGRLRLRQVADAETLEQIARIASREGHVALDRQVREQRVLLEHHAHGPRLDRDVHPRGSIEEQATGKLDPSGVGPQEAGDHAEQRRLARARRSDEGQGFAPHVEVDAYLERGEPQAHIPDDEAHLDHPEAGPNESAPRISNFTPTRSPPLTATSSAAIASATWKSAMFA
jgi:2-hydroxy-3-oxopropionate reductase